MEGLEQQSGFPILDQDIMDPPGRIEYGEGGLCLHEGGRYVPLLDVSPRCGEGGDE